MTIMDRVQISLLQSRRIKANGCHWMKPMAI